MPMRPEIKTMEEILTIPAREIGAGAGRWSWHVGKEFFDSFETSEINDASLEVEAEVSGGDGLHVKCQVRGSVTVQCDRCLGDLVLPVDSSFEDDECQETAGILDLRQDVYDYVCLSLPMQRVHEEGGCDPEMLKYLAS